MTGICIEYNNHCSKDNNGLRVKTCRFAGRYKIMRPSVIDGLTNSNLIIEGISGVELRNDLFMGIIRTLPLGQLQCTHCSQWRIIDKYNRAWAVRDGMGNGHLLIKGLICENCVNLDIITSIPGVRFGYVCHEDCSFDIRNTAKEALVKRAIKRWKNTIKVRKERREFARSVCLVGKKIIEDTGHNWNYFLEGAMKCF